MIKETGITNMNCLLDTMMKDDIANTPRDKLLLLIEDYLEEGIEYWVDGKRAGYALMMNCNGERCFHGHKIIEGYAVAAYRIAKRMTDKYPKAYIGYQEGNASIERLTRMLGFKETLRVGINVKTERN